jgi:enamine deaminase RidA (YjgF/YER057c/UK114 family)
MHDGSLPDGIELQLERAVANINDELAASGLRLENIVKVTIYLLTMQDYDDMNRAYLRVMPDVLPARTCIAVSELPFGARVELDVIAQDRSYPL